MRNIIHRQLKIGETDIGAIDIDTRSRDEIPQLLKGLQHIYCTPELNEKVFAILQDVVPKGIDTNNGRPGMELWKILVLGSLRLVCNWDYDKLKEIADNHKTLRQMLGHGFEDDDKTYPVQTLKDNIALLTPEVLNRINQVVVEAGHQQLHKKKEVELEGRCDSFVVETDVHFPTDINLLFDAFRKALTLIAALCSQIPLSDWRQSAYLIRKVKRLFRVVQKMKRSTSKNPEKKKEQEKKIEKAYKNYLSEVEYQLDRVCVTLEKLESYEQDLVIPIFEIRQYLAHADRQIDQIRRRVILGETIAHREKVFSIFEPHTEWIAKGKAGVSQELGLAVCILEDQYGFILNHRVMQHEKDIDIAVSFTKETVEKFPGLSGCSYDKGFYSPQNREDLEQILENVILPKKGRLSARDCEREYSEDFRQLRRRHSAIESAINALENHGLDRCSDHGIVGFERYVSLAVIARNLQKLGKIVLQKEQKTKRRKAA